MVFKESCLFLRWVKVRVYFYGVVKKVVKREYDVVEEKWRSEDFVRVEEVGF